MEPAQQMEMLQRKYDGDCKYEYQHMENLKKKMQAVQHFFSRFMNWLDVRSGGR
jgi:hypothetical protein